MKECLLKPLQGFMGTGKGFFTSSCWAKISSFHLHFLLRHLSDCGPWKETLSPPGFKSSIGNLVPWQRTGMASNGVEGLLGCSQVGSAFTPSGVRIVWPFLVFSPKVLTCQQSHADLTGFLPQPGSGPEKWRLFATGTKQGQHPARPEGVC